MRVLIIPSYYPASDEPNRGIFFQQQAQSCVREDVEIHILYYELRSLKKLKSYKNWRNYFQTKSYRENNLLVYRCHAWNIVPTKFKLGEEIWLEASFWHFKRYIILYGLPDVIHVQSAFPAAKLVYRIKQKYNIPYFINEHATKVKLGHFSTQEIKNYQDLFKAADRIVAVSETFKQLISNRFSINSDHIRVIPNFINTDFFSPNDLQSKNENSLIFLVVCFLERKKRIDRLIDAFYEAFKNDKNVKLIIGGDGPEKGNIFKKIKAYDLQNQVTLMGNLSQEQVRDQMRLCNCFILPSEVETFGVVLIEAMATGKPVIATRSGGPEDFVTNKVGVLAENDVSSIKNALIKMRNEVNAFDANLIRQFVLNNFSSQAISNKVIELYKEIVSGQNN